MLFIWLNQFAFCCMSWRWKNVNRPSMEKRCDLKASFLKLGKEKLICLVYGLTKGLLQKLKSVEIIDIHAKKNRSFNIFRAKTTYKKITKAVLKKSFCEYFGLLSTLHHSYFFVVFEAISDHEICYAFSVWTGRKSGHICRTLQEYLYTCTCRSWAEPLPKRCT